MSVICCDLDSVLVIPPAIEIASEDLGYDYNETHVSHFDLAMFPEDMRQRVFRYYTDPVIMCEKVRIIEGAQDKIKQWKSEGHKIYVITARDHSLYDQTWEMVYKNFPEMDDVFLVGVLGNKNPALEELSCDLFIDDSPSNVTNAIEIGIKSILISNKYTKYNHQLRDSGKVKYYKSIGEIESW